MSETRTVVRKKSAFLLCHLVAAGRGRVFGEWRLAEDLPGHRQGGGQKRHTRGRRHGPLRVGRQKRQSVATSRTTAPSPFGHSPSRGRPRRPAVPEGTYRVTVQFPYPAGSRPILAVILPKPYKVEPKDDNTFTFEVRPSRKQ